MRIRVLVSALAAIAACLAFSVGASASAAPAEAGLSSSAKVYRNNSLHAQEAVQAASTRNLDYLGGAVFTSPAIFIIYWGRQWATGFTTGGYSSAKAQAYVNAFFGGVGGSPWLNSQTQYCQNVPRGSQFCAGVAGAQSVTNPGGQLKGTWNDTTAVPTHPTDGQVRAAAQRGAAHFGFNPNALYMVMTPHGHSISGFMTSFCAYHDNTTFNGRPLAYANIPYQPDAGAGCGRNFVNRTNNAFGNGFFDGFSIVTGHEYAEAVTDAYPSQAVAWNDSRGNETGDKCAWNAGPGPSRSANITLGGHAFAVQALWSNLANSRTGGCVISG